MAFHLRRRWLLCGKPRTLDEGKAKLARRLETEDEHSVDEYCTMSGAGQSKLYRYLQDGHETNAED